jgi:hypothetical protein
MLHLQTGYVVTFSPRARQEVTCSGFSLKETIRIKIPQEKISNFLGTQKISNVAAQTTTTPCHSIDNNTGLHCSQIPKPAHTHITEDSICSSQLHGSSKKGR